MGLPNEVGELPDLRILAGKRLVWAQNYLLPWYSISVHYTATIPITITVSMFISLVHKVLLSAWTHIHMPSLRTKLYYLQQEGLAIIWVELYQGLRMQAHFN